METGPSIGWRRSDKVMKQLLVLIIVILLTGCNNSIKDAKANSIRQQTRRANDKHNSAMADSRALATTRIVVKEVLLWSLMVGGVIVVISGAGGLAWLFVGGSVNIIRHQRTQQIALDVATRQYPLLVYGNGRRIFNPNNGERLLLSDVSTADLPRIEASTKVQLAGLITDNSTIING
jgi:hypothetical protein